MKLVQRYDLQPKGDNPQILDVGCGNNPEWDATVIMDIDNTIMTFKTKTFVCHDANKMPWPFKNGQFDRIYMNNILEHLDTDDGRIFREAYRILKVYDKVEIHVPNSLFIYHRLLYLFGIIPCDFILCHKKHHSFQQMKHNLRNANFKIFEMNNKWVFNPLKNWFCPHIIITAKKVG